MGVKMDLEVQTEDDEGNIVFKGTLKKHEVDFVLNVGINFLLANGASPFIKDDTDVEDTMVGPGTDIVQ
jgi:hypothetical protein